MATTADTPLPAPSTQALQHCENLVAHIRHAIAENAGAISFARYMELALYAPGLGYYSAGSEKFGPHGDFITAPELSPLFSHCIAEQCRQVLNMSTQTAPMQDILEFGAGHGNMAADILLALQQNETLPKHYYIIEPSPDLQQRQHATINDKCPDLLPYITWLHELPQTFCGVILANEVLDAMPIHLFQLRNGESYSRTVIWDTEQKIFAYKNTPISHPPLRARVTQLAENYPYLATMENFTSEINLLAPAWIKSVSQCLERGIVLLIDYGFPAHEYYHPQRQHGTLMCHYRHRAHSDPFLYPGLQDITAHVDFTAIAQAAVDNQLEVAGFCNQAAFLLSCGIADAMLTGTPQIDFKQQVMQLTSPNAMGELFKVMALTRNIETPLLGFNLQDMLHRL